MKQMKKLTKRSFIEIAFALLLTSLLFSCKAKKDGKNSESETESLEEKAMTVNTWKIEKTSLSDYIEFSGNVFARNSVDMYSPVSGKITRIFVKAGDKVSANQIIAEVDSSRPGAVYAASPVRSSIAGTVVALPARIGAQVSTSSVLATIGQIENLEIRMEVPERFSSLIKSNQEALVSLTAFPEETISARVSEISPVIDSGSRSVNVILNFTSENAVKLAKAGMSARIHLITERLENIIAIPSRALLYEDNQAFVFIAEGQNAVRKAVETGLKVDGLIEIKNGLSENDLLIIKGQSLITDRQIIKAVEIDL